jgi:pantoate--beta-alanine ligase
VLERIETIARLRGRLARRAQREGGLHERESLVGLVPTMGALHAGHAELIKTARRHCDLVVVSIFVNPLQFDRPDDLAKYPKTLDADLSLCRELSVDVVFTPSPTEIYPEPPQCTVDVGRLADHLCGKFRPGHFRGVATVVLKLFQIVQPDRAYFGEKDAQQLAIIRRLVGDLNVPVEIVEVPTVREADGLALSSRNQHLSVEQRPLAIALFNALFEAQRRIAAGDRDAAAIKKAAGERIPQSETTRLEYLEVVDPSTMQPVDRISGPVRVAGAIWLGETRLIDNLLCHPGGSLQFGDDPHRDR